MKRFIFLTALVVGSLLTPVASADEIAPEYREAIQKGLAYLAKQQHRDGHWEADAGQYPVAMTAFAGMALLMEGSTIRDGTYTRNLRIAVDWLLERSQRNGLIGNANSVREASRYMFGHGLAMLFLSSAYGEEEDAKQRRRMTDVLTRAADFTAKAQTKNGGWGYVAAVDGSDFAEGPATVTVLQGLRAVRAIGVPISQPALDNALKYLEKSTTKRGGVVYRLGSDLNQSGGERPAVTAAALAAAFSADEYIAPLPKKWLKYCQDAVLPLSSQLRFGFDEWTHYYFSQAMYKLGDDGYGRLFPDSKPEERLSWRKYRKVTFDNLLKTQNPDGSWTSTGGVIGTVYTTSLSLAILQLDSGLLPIYQR